MNTKRWMLALVGFLAVLWGAPSDAAAQSTYTILSNACGKALDVPNGSPADHVPIQIYTRHGGPNQRWYLQYAGSAPHPVLQFGGPYVIISYATGKVLDVPNGSTNDGVVIQQYTSHGGPNQQWFLTWAGDGSMYIRNANSGKYLTVRACGDNVYVEQSSPTNGREQRWFVF